MCAFQFIQVPENEAEWINIANDFEQKWNFPNCLGALDGKHINIRAPPASGSTFFNYKHCFSVVLMALVDANYRFIYCDVGCNGRISDGGVFKGCSLNDALSSKTINLPRPSLLPGTNDVCSYHMVADEAFPLKDEIMKPYPFRKCSKEQLIFNYRLSRARRVVENAFGILASRFRVFSTNVAIDVANVDKLVMAACALHNYLITDGESQYFTPSMVDVEDTESHVVRLGTWRECQMQSVGILHNNNPTVAAKSKREVLTKYFMSPAGEVAWQSGMI